MPLPPLLLQKQSSPIVTQQSAISDKFQTPPPDIRIHDISVKSQMPSSPLIVIRPSSPTLPVKTGDLEPCGSNLYVFHPSLGVQPQGHMTDLETPPEGPTFLSSFFLHKKLTGRCIIFHIYVHMYVCITWLNPNRQLHSFPLPIPIHSFRLNASPTAMERSHPCSHK